MASSATSVRELFNQAVIDSSPASLSRIRADNINLAIWENPLSAPAKEYLEDLSIEKLIANSGQRRDGYYYRVSSMDAPKRLNTYEKRRGAIAQLLSAFPKKPGKKNLAGDLERVIEAFKRAVGPKKVTMSCLIFEPNDEAFWHEDSSSGQQLYRGNITLVGDVGMIWRPNHTLQNLTKDEYYWGHVDPERDAGVIQTVPAQDFAIFKCNALPNPLIHATPPQAVTAKPRLACIMSQHI